MSIRIPAIAPDHAETVAMLDSTLTAVEYVDGQVDYYTHDDVIDADSLGNTKTAEIQQTLSKLDAVVQTAWSLRIDLATTETGRLLTTTAQRAAALAAAIREALETL